VSLHYSVKYLGLFWPGLFAHLCTSTWACSVSYCPKSIVRIYCFSNRCCIGSLKLLSHRPMSDKCRKEWEIITVLIKPYNLI